MRHSVNLNHTGIGNAAISFYNPKTIHGIFIYNNSFINLPPSFSSVGINSEVTVTNVVIRNNLWYNTADATTGPNTGNTTASHNYFIGESFWSGETNTQVTPTTNPFVNWPGSCSGTVCSGEDFHLIRATNNGLSLSSPYNTDPDGVTRGADGTWDRGAFEFGGSSCSPVISSVTLNPTSVVGGNTSTGTVTLSCAPTSNTVVSLSSSNTAVATVPATVTVLANQTTATFTVTTVGVCVSTNVTITATLNGSTTASLTVTVGGALCQGAVVEGKAKISGTAKVQ